MSLSKVDWKVAPLLLQGQSKHARSLVARNLARDVLEFLLELALVHAIDAVGIRQCVRSGLVFQGTVRERIRHGFLHLEGIGQKGARQGSEEERL